MMLMILMVMLVAMLGMLMMKLGMTMMIQIQTRPTATLKLPSRMKPLKKATTRGVVPNPARSVGFNMPSVVLCSSAAGKKLDMDFTRVRWTCSPLTERRESGLWWPKGWHCRWLHLAGITGLEGLALQDLMLGKTERSELVCSLQDPVFAA